MASEEKCVHLQTERGVKTDKHFPVNCDPCQIVGKLIPVTSFCTVCKEFLCNGCARTHAGSELFREHKLIQGKDLHDAVPQRFPIFPFQFCDSHRDQVVEHYCSTHKEVICSACKTVNHRVCRGVEEIPFLCKGTSASGEANCFLKGMKSHLSNLKRLKQEKWQELDQLANKKQTCLDGLIDLRKKINEYLDQLETDMKHQIDAVIAKTGRQLKMELSALEITIKSIEDGTKCLDDASRHRNDPAFFIAMKKINQRKMETVIKDFEAEKRTLQLSYDGQATLSKLQDNIHSFGHLQADFSSSRDMKVDLDEPRMAPLNVPEVNVKDMKAQKIGEFSITEQNEEHKCCITASTFIRDGRVLLNDHGNQKVKMMSRDLDLLTSLPVPSKPWDIAAISDTELVITLPYDKKLQFLAVEGNNLKLGRQIQLYKKCWGVATHKNMMYVSCHNNPRAGEVLLVGMQGAVARRYRRTGEAFVGPFYVTINDNGDKMYVSDYYNCSVSCLDLAEGQTLYTYSARNLKPETTFAGVGDWLVVCCRSSSTIRVLDKDGARYKTLLTTQDGLHEPNSISYRSSDRTLVVGSLSSKILVYRFCQKL